MAGMVHIARALVPYAVNKIVHERAVPDPALRRIINNDKSLQLVREGLCSLDSQLDVLIPYKVDDPERQLKRFIQWKYGTTVNLSELRKGNVKYYHKLFAYGSPNEVLERWGLSCTYNRIYTEDELRVALQDYKRDGKIYVPFKESRMYQIVRRFAVRKGQTVSKYLDNMNKEEG